MQLLEAVSNFPVGKAVIVPRKCCLGNNVHPELPLIGAVGVCSNGFCSTRAALVVVAVVPGDFWRLRIRNLLDESGADAHRLVEVVAALGTTVASDLNFFVGISCRTPLRVVTVLPTGSATVSSDIVVFIVLLGRGLVGPRPSLTGRSMRILVLPQACFEFFDPVALLFYQFVLFFDQFSLFVDLFVLLAEFLFQL